MFTYHFSVPPHFVLFFFSISVSTPTQPRTLLISVMCSCFVVVVQLLNHVQLFRDPMNCRPPGSLSMGFPRQEYCSGLPFPSPGDLLHLGIEVTSPAFQVNFLPLSQPDFSHTFTHLRLQNLLFMTFTVFTYVIIYVSLILQQRKSFSLGPVSTLSQLSFIATFQRNILTSPSNFNVCSPASTLFQWQLCSLSQEPVASKM